MDILFGFVAVMSVVIVITGFLFAIYGAINRKAVYFITGVSMIIFVYFLLNIFTK